MIFIVESQIYVSNPSKDLIEWCTKELEIPNPEYSKKLRMGFWTGDTPKVLSLYKCQKGELILPFGVLSLLPVTILRDAVIIDVHGVIPSIDYHANVELYEYQQDAVDAMALRGYGILQSPAGSGKTQMGIALAVKLGKPCLWICHTLDLVRQSKERAERYIKDESLIGMISEGKVNISKGITFATVQTLAKLDLREYENQWDTVIVDECHRVSGTPTTVTQYERVLNKLNATYKFGLSATVHRADGLIKATYCLLGNITYRVPQEEVADRIMKVGICPIETQTQISRECLNTDGTLNYTNLITYLCNDELRNEAIVDRLKSCDGHSVLILSSRLEHLAKLMDMCPARLRRDAMMISGRMTSKKGKTEREQALEDMRTGKIHYLFATYALAKEGLDIPCLDRLLLVTPQKDYAVVTQSIGRIDRKCEGKTDAIVYDYVDDIDYCIRAWRKRLSIYRKNRCEIG
ncbi:MAG: DEAD/DEAH box helicase [Firmicutes bacterium]|nr:DEAD/DEAH box helicase [Bacillota bacterium]